MVLCRGRAGLWPPAAHRSRDPAAHDNRGVITSTLLTRLSVPPRLSALRFQHSRHVIIAALLTISLPVSQQPLFRRQYLLHVIPVHAISVSTVKEVNYFTDGQG